MSSSVLLCCILLLRWIVLCCAVLCGRMPAVNGLLWGTQPRWCSTAPHCVSSVGSLVHCSPRALGHPRVPNRAPNGGVRGFSCSVQRVHVLVYAYSLQYGSSMQVCCLCTDLHSPLSLPTQLTVIPAVIALCDNLIILCRAYLISNCLKQH